MMKNELASRRRRAIVCGFTALSSTLVAAHAADPDQHDGSGWTLSASANVLFNVSAKFSGHPQTPTLTNPNIQPGAVNYDNGYVGRDISGDPNFSTYWGYTQAGQPIVAGGFVTGLNYQQTTAGAGAVSPNRNAGASFGGEITLRREIFRGESFRAGLEGGFNFDPVSIKDSAGYNANAQQTSVSYNLAAPVSTVLFPPPGYSGPFNGAGPNINPTPNAGATTTVVPNAAVITGSRKVDADIFGFRLGPYLELPFTDNFSASVSAGALITVVRDEVTWSENLAVNTTTTGFWTGSSSVSGSSSGVTAGFYAGADASYRFCKNWSAVAGARFLDSGTYSHNLGAGKMELDLGRVFSVNLGLSWTF